MAFYQWNDQYLVNIREIDAQHKKLLELVNELYVAMQAGKGKNVLEKTLAGLIEYTATHFATEEKLLEKYGYPDLAEHKREHASLTERVMQIQKDYLSGKMALSVELSNFLRDWVLNHILSTDQKYSAFLNSLGIR